MKVVSMRGEHVDVAKYLAANETTIAVGNAKLNARGDIIGPGGKIIKKREDIAAEYQQKGSRNTVRHVALKDLSAEVLPTAAEAVQKILDDQKSRQEVAKKSSRKISDSE